MLKDLLKKANFFKAELEEKKQSLEKTEHDLLSVKASLDEFNSRVSERLNEGYSRKVYSLHEKIQRLTAQQHTLAQEIADGERAFAAAKASALEFIKSRGLTFARVSSEEDEIVYEQLVAKDETRIIDELFSAQEECGQAMSRLDHCRVKVVDAERDDEVIRLRTAFNYAKKNLDEFRVRMSSAPMAQKQALARDEYVLEERVERAKEEFKKLLSEYGVLHLFSELEMAETEYNEAAARCENSKKNADGLPLAAPVSVFEKGKGVITSELMSDSSVTFHANEPHKIRREQRLAGGYGQADTENRRELDYINREIAVRRRTSGEERERLSSELRAIQDEIAMLKREAVRARSDVNEIKRAKMLAALNVKRSLLAASRSAAAAKAAERELIKNKLAALNSRYGDNENR